MIKFYRGARENFDAEKHSNGIYFTNDTTEILTGEESSYGKIVLEDSKWYCRLG